MAEHDDHNPNDLNGATPPGSAAAAAAATAEAHPHPSDAAPADRAAELTTTVARLNEEKRELNDRMLRVAADYENYKRRTRKEMEEAGVRGTEGLLREILPVLDNLDRALQTPPKGDAETLLASLHTGVGLVQKQFLGALEKFQIRSFDAQGKPFDPAIHEAVAQVDSDTIPPGCVAAVYQRGYTAGSRLLRPALVAVVRGKAAAPGAAEPAEIEIEDLSKQGA